MAILPNRQGEKGRIWSLKGSALFFDASDSVLDWAGSAARELTFTRGDVVSRMDDPRRQILVIADGRVKLRLMTESGKESILDIMVEGDAFGPLDDLIDGGRKEAPRGPRMPTEAVAMTKGVALAFDYAEFERLVQRRPTVIFNVSRILGLQQRRLEIRLCRLLYRGALGKLAGLLAELGERYGEPAGDGNGNAHAVVLPFKLTHQEMASLVGVKRETISEGMGILELDELIAHQDGRIVILQPQRLDQIL